MWENGEKCESVLPEAQDDVTDIQFTVIEEQWSQNMFTFKKPKSLNITQTDSIIKIAGGWLISDNQRIDLLIIAAFFTICAS